MNPIRLLLRSRKFWLLILDLTVSSVAFIAGRQATPEAQAYVTFFIASLQPVFVFLISAIAYEDAATKRAAPPYLLAHPGPTDEDRNANPR
jgi:hypothetical protein